jgi:hypothetical protein
MTYYNNANNDLTKKISLTVSAIGLAASMSWGISSCNNSSRLEAELMTNPDYVEATRLEELRSKLDNSVNELTYRSAYTTIMPCGKTCIPIFHSARYPDALDAKQTINYVAGEVKNLETTIDENLRGIAAELPEQNRVTQYAGKSVDNKTFQTQRTEIATEQNSIKQIENSHLSKVPKSLLEEKTSQEHGMVLAWILGGVAAIVGLYGLMKSDY